MTPTTAAQTAPPGDSGNSGNSPDDVLVVGEALVDIVLADGRDPVEHPGGSPANVALGLARLGRSTSLLTRVGEDERGRSVLDHLRASGVDVLPASLTPGPTSTARATLDPQGVASYEFELDWRLPEDTGLDALPPFRALHTGSIAAFLEPGGDQVLDLVRQARGRMTVSYDPNARPRLMGEQDAAGQRVETIVGLSDLVKVSDEDLEWLCPGEAPEDVAVRWLALGPAVVVVTRGGEGAIARCAAGRVAVPGRRIDLVDTVGAGDSFTSALLDHLAGADLLGAERLDALRGVELGTVEAMLHHAVQVSAITCSRPGADPPRRSELAAG